jgi:competence protein ComGC
MNDDALAPLAMAIVMIIILLLIIVFVPGVKETIISIIQAWKGS